MSDNITSASHPMPTLGFTSKLEINPVIKSLGPVYIKRCRLTGLGIPK